LNLEQYWSLGVEGQTKESDAQIALRHSSVDIDAMLTFWGYKTTFGNTFSELLVRQWATEFGVPESKIPALSSLAIPDDMMKKYGITHFYDVNVGICHQVLPEEGFALPGYIIIGSDSHTTTYGAFGSFATGIGRTEMAVIFATGKIWIRIPESIKIVLKGKLKRESFQKMSFSTLSAMLGLREPHTSRWNSLVKQLKICPSMVA
jgi:homoaconitase/3-isopropylmalate dehydratase large subunit